MCPCDCVMKGPPADTCCCTSGHLAKRGCCTSGPCTESVCPGAADALFHVDSKSAQGVGTTFGRVCTPYSFTGGFTTGAVINLHRTARKGGTVMASGRRYRRASLRGGVQELWWPIILLSRRRSHAASECSRRRSNAARIVLRMSTVMCPHCISSARLYASSLIIVR